MTAVIQNANVQDISTRGRRLVKAAGLGGIPGSQVSAPQARRLIISSVIDRFPGQVDGPNPIFTDKASMTNRQPLARYRATRRGRSRPPAPATPSSGT